MFKNLDEFIPLLKDADKVWFNICHELDHAVKNKKRHLTISYEKDKIIDDEIFANNFARDYLINPKEYKKFISKNDLSIDSMEVFAKTQEIPLFILIGRLQSDGYLNWNEFAKNKVKYEMSFKY